MGELYQLYSKQAVKNSEFLTELQKLNKEVKLSINKRANEWNRQFSKKKKHA